MPLSILIYACAWLLFRSYFISARQWSWLIVKSMGIRQETARYVSVCSSMYGCVAMCAPALPKGLLNWGPHLHLACRMATLQPRLCVLLRLPNEDFRARQTNSNKLLCGDWKVFYHTHTRRNKGNAYHSHKKYTDSLNISVNSHQLESCVLL